MERSPRKFNFYVNYIYLLKSLLSLKLDKVEEAMEQAEKAREECITSVDIPQLAACPWHTGAVMCHFPERARELRAASFSAARLLLLLALCTP